MQNQEILQQKLERWCAESIRALAGERSARYRGHYLMLEDQPILLQAPYLHLNFDTCENKKLRGIADAIALRLLHSDTLLHKELSPEAPVAQLIFELLEQFRCESLVPASKPGMLGNLRRRFLFWAHQAGSSQLVENSIGLLIYTVNMMCWSRLSKCAIPEQIEDLIETTRWKLANTIGPQMRLLTATIDKQEEFAEPALAIANRIQSMVDEVSTPTIQDDNSDETLRALANARLVNLQWLGADYDTLSPNRAISRTEEIDPVSSLYSYQVYDRAYDIEVKAERIIRPAQLKKLRARLDKHVRQQSVNTHRVARYLNQLITTPCSGGWSFAEEQGYVDSARLSRLITSPNDRRLFKRISKNSQASCIVSICVDNSGSMTHYNMEIAALIDSLVRVLELAGINSEVLGYTTTDWNGGTVAKQWVAHGSPANPGRLTSLCHTVYKSANTPWRRARPAISGLLKSENFREGVDGEALLWAVKRIENRPESRKIILVISDGSPMDTATHAANHDRYLDHHLVEVATDIELRTDISLCGIGVGLDLGNYFRESMSISLADDVQTKDFISIADLINRAA